ncbi:MAG: isopentenyl-diphosphate Delta-isomerase [Agromyces sp.]
MGTPSTEGVELVVLVDEDGRPIGTTPKESVHTTTTPFHLAFSCYVLNEHDELLITRRALSKVAWPGVWTNSFCGHPGPNESFESAIHRRASVELGTEVTNIESVLPEFRYRAVDASGIVEYEFCPVFTARLSADIRPNPDEVMDVAWVPFAELVRTAETMPELLSPWMVWQLPQIAASRNQL